VEDVIGDGAAGAVTNHRFPSLLNQVPRAPLKVNVKDQVPARLRDLQKGDEVGDAGDLDLHVQVSDLLDRQIHSAAHHLTEQTLSVTTSNCVRR
jgi:hypothetical protein